MKWFSSDWHLGHSKTIELGSRPFKDADEMDNTIIENMFYNVKRGDDFYFLGDLAWNASNIIRVLEVAAKKKIRFHWILGNHDFRFVKQFQGRIKQYNQLNSMHDIFEVKLTDEEGKHYPTFLSHYPMLTWNKSHYNSFLLFGHHHQKTHKADEIRKYELQGKRLNVCCEFYDYKPVNELEVIEIMSKRPNNWDYIERSKK